MTRTYEPVKRVVQSEPMEGLRESHPCFGMARLSRVHGDRDLFGSIVQGRGGFVTLEISRAERHHSYSTDRLFGRETMIEIAMTESQFAELITTWNMGEGVPVTLDCVRDGKLQEVPGLESEDVSEVTRARDHFKARLDERTIDFKATIKDLHKILDKKGGIGKTDREAIKNIFWQVERWFSDEAPYSVTTFTEATEQLVQKAKTEVEAFVSGVIHKTGLDALNTMRLQGTSEDTKQIKE